MKLHGISILFILKCHLRGTGGAQVADFQGDRECPITGGSKQRQLGP